jgi:outer membrane protein OmpA-like peptidoglycan-associated protein
MKYGRSLSLVAMLLLAVMAIAQTSDTPIQNPDKIDVVTPTVLPPAPILFGPEQQEFRQNLQDVLFDFDQAVINLAGKQTLQADAEWLKQHPDVNFYIDGYADWRGPLLYNLRLAQDRADAVKQALMDMGIAADRISIVAGWGKLYPLCADQDESCWSRNRRVNFVYAPSGTEARVASAR